MGTFILDKSILKNDPVDDGALDEQGQLIIHPYEFWKPYTRYEIGAFCTKYGYYCLPTTELIHWLNNELGDNKAIEIGAGSGILSRALGIPATDNRMQEWPEIMALYAAEEQACVPYGDHVLKMDAATAIEELRPHTVLASWVTHKRRPKEAWRKGNAYGVEEEKLIAKVRYIFIGNELIHQYKPIRNLEHKKYKFPWLLSRAMNDTDNFIAIWEKGAKRARR